jgi:hypothetical protein
MPTFPLDSTILYHVSPAGCYILAVDAARGLCRPRRRIPREVVLLDEPRRCLPALSSSSLAIVGEQSQEIALRVMLG